VRDDGRRDGAVVVEQVALRDALLRPEELVEVRELHAVLLGLDGVFAPHRAGRLVVAEPLEGRRAQMAVVRPLREGDLAHELRLDPDDVALAHLRHLRHGREGRRLAPQRLELREELVDLALAEAGAAVPDPGELPAAPHTEDERAEAPLFSQSRPRLPSW
jgi:hypothetical protein